MPKKLHPLLSKTSLKGRSREEQTILRKQAILDAAFLAFTQHGFAASKMETIATQAAVGKGTIYTYFSSKEALLEELVKEKILPILPQEFMPTASSIEESLYTSLSHILERLLSGEPGMLLQLIFAEGERFPQITTMYYETVIDPAMQRVRHMLTVATQRGELLNSALQEFPQLLLAPILQSFIWNKFFSIHQSLNYNKMLRLHLRCLFSARPTTLSEQVS